jgi:hypothetical protein
MASAIWRGQIDARTEVEGRTTEWQCRPSGTRFGENIMHKLLAIGGAAVLALWAVAASADQLTGTISNIDLTRNSFTLEGWEFRASPYNTVGTKLSELKDGDKVTIEYTTGGGGGREKWPMNVMILKKVG